MSTFSATAIYASGEKEHFTEPAEFLKTVREELHYRNTTGFHYKMEHADAETRKAVDDLLFNEYGEENPHDLAYYLDEIGGTGTPNEKLNTELYQKMFAEQESYREWLLSQSPEEILHHAYEYTMREDILQALENNDLEDGQAAVLLKSPSPLSDIFQDFERMVTDQMENVWDCIAQRADFLLQREAKEKQQQRELSVYHYSVAYATEHGELEQYRASNRANYQCKEAIEAAVREHFDGMYLSHDAASGVVQTYGMERVMLVLANTVQLQDWDGRYSHRNKEWAKTIPNHNSDTVRRGYAVNSHPAVLDGFIDLVREEYQRGRSMPPRISVREKLKQEPTAHKPAAPKKREPER